MKGSDDECISEPARTLLRTCIAGYEDLESLLLLRRHPDREWTAEQVAIELKIASTSAATALQRLLQGGVLRMRPGTEPSYAFCPADEAMRRSCMDLAQAWETNHLAVVEAMSAEAMIRLRTSAMRAFADAFRVRKSKDDG